MENVMGYSPNLGRWLERDPAEYVDGLNSYEYERSGPISRLDPLGLCTEGEKTATIPIDGKPFLVETTTDRIDPDEMDSLLKAGHAVTTAIKFLPTGGGTKLYPGPKVADQMTKPDNVKKVAEAYAEQRFLWIRVERGRCVCGEVVVDEVKWYPLHFGEPRGTNAEDVSQGEVIAAIRKLRDELRRG
jgi:hypothetical protein